MDGRVQALPGEKRPGWRNLKKEEMRCDMSSYYQVHPLVRSYGKARIEITRQAKDEREWQELWRPPQHQLPFRWGRSWKQCVEYTVDDFASEVGFFIDLLGFLVDEFSPSYARLTTPGEEFFFAISARRENEPATPADALRLQFCVEDLEETVQELERRGIQIEHLAFAETTGWSVANFRTPHGIWVDLVTLSERMGTGEGASEALIESDSDAISQADEGVEDEISHQVKFGEDEKQIETDMDPVELVLSQKDEDREADGLLPSWIDKPGRRDRLSSRRSRPRPANRFNEFALNDFKRTASRSEASAKTSDRPRTNGELTYVEIEDEDEPQV